MSNVSSKPTVLRTSDNNRPVRLWGIGSALLVLAGIIVGAPIVAQLGLSLVLTILGWNKYKVQAWLSNASLANFLFILATEGLSVFLLWVFISRRGKSFTQSVGLFKPRWRYIWHALLGLLVYVALFGVVFGIVQNLIHIDTNAKQALGFQPGAKGLDLMLAFIGLVILPPVAEEILFRGFLYGTIRSRLSKWPTILITSLIFAGLHLFTGTTDQLLWTAFFDVATLSLVLCYLREQSGTIWASIGLHALKNFLVFLNLFVIGIH